MSENLVAEWNRIKADFEGATRKKKPSEKLLGFVNKSSGLTPALKAMDGAWDSYPDFIVARRKFNQVKADYLGVLKKALVAAAAVMKTDPAAKDFVAAIETMRLDLENIEVTISNRAGHFDGCMKDALAPVDKSETDAKKLFTDATQCMSQLEAMVKGKKAFIAKLAELAQQMASVEATLSQARKNYDEVVGSGPASTDTGIQRALTRTDMALKNYGAVSKKLKDTVVQYRRLLNEPG